MGTGVAATVLAKQLGPGHRIVTVLCDSGTRHLSRFWKSVGESDGRGLTMDEILLMS